MQKYLLTLLIATAAFNANASCESVQSQINQKIINNGVPENSFTLKIEPAKQAASQEDKIIGNCNNGENIIVYQKNDNQAAHPASQ